MRRQFKLRTGLEQNMLARIALLCYIYICAGVVKLADALDSKSCGVKSVSVRVRPPAPTSKNASLRRSVGVFLMSAPCLHERGHKKKRPNRAIGARRFCECRTGAHASRAPPCLHERGHKKKDQTAPSSPQGNSRRSPHFCADFLHPTLRLLFASRKCKPFTRSSFSASRKTIALSLIFAPRHIPTRYHFMASVTLWVTNSEKDSRFLIIPLPKKQK